MDVQALVITPHHFTPWSALILLAACGDDGARARCDRALERARSMNPAEVSVYIAHECAGAFAGRCAETMRNIEDYSALERLDRLAADCKGQATRSPLAFLDPRMAIKPKGYKSRDVDLADTPRTPRVVVHDDHVDVERSPQNQRIDLSCDALAVALDGVARPVIEVQLAAGVEYEKVIETMDCLVRHGFKDVGLVP